MFCRLCGRQFSVTLFRFIGMKFIVRINISSVVFRFINKLCFFFDFV